MWLVTERDNGMVLEGSQSDLVVSRFREHASSGYVWQFGELADAGLAIREDGRASEAGDQHIGGVVFRTVVAEAEERRAAATSTLREVRPWQTDRDAIELAGTRRRFVRAGGGRAPIRPA